MSGEHDIGQGLDNTDSIGPAATRITAAFKRDWCHGIWDTVEGMGDSVASVQVFIISWPGQHSNAEAIAKAVCSPSDGASIVYSDPDPHYSPIVDCRLIRRPNHLFWGDKFQACLESCTSDVLLVIHADCKCQDWSALVPKCREALLAHPNIGAWAPLIDWTPWALTDTQIVEIPNSNLTVVANTDGIVFAIQKGAVDRMKRCAFAENVYGWGIDWMFTCYTYASQKIAVVDRSLLVTHPRTAKYSHELAARQRNTFLQAQLTLAEKIQYKILRSYAENKRLYRTSRTSLAPAS